MIAMDEEYDCFRHHILRIHFSKSVSPPIRTVSLYLADGTAVWTANFGIIMCIIYSVP